MTSWGFDFRMFRELIHTLREIRDLHINQKANSIIMVWFHIAFHIELLDKYFNELGIYIKLGI